jgi:hypothetical protein
MPLEEAMAQAGPLLEAAAARLIRAMRVGGGVRW